jgi:NADH:ubiquinone oxidoreductase subunit 4 (subunit M)
MNLVMLGIFSFNVSGIESALLQSISHGFVASALFLIIGVVYDRHHTRMITYFGGLAYVMPVHTFVFFFFTIANIGLPGTSSFVGEFLILVGSFKINTSITFFGATGMILEGCYSLWFFNRIAYGNLKVQYCKNFLDLNKKEFLIFVPLIIETLALGLLPNIALTFMHMSVNKLIEFIYF